jgi:hypothetical protein
MSDEWAPPGVDITVPNVARIYDYWLGGKDNFDVDRKAAHQIMTIAPEARFMARQNRMFLGRVVEFLVREVGIRQIIDIGTGLPTQDNVHEVAHSIAPDTRVVYVDYDPVVIVHARAMLSPSERVHILKADLRRPDEILQSPAVREDLDLSQPVAVIVTALFHFITDQDEPSGIIDRFREAMAPGSYLALSHSCLESGPEAAAKITEIYKNATAPAVLRTRDQIRRLFDGFDLIDPGLVYTPQWRRDASSAEPDPRKAWMLAGLGRKKD